MNALLFGATGMIGTGVLLECLADPRVDRVVAVNRAPLGMEHPKLREIVSSDLGDLDGHRDELAGQDVCFYCVGVSSVGMDEETYHRITFDLTARIAGAIAEVRPGMTFCFVSGQGTDSTEQGKIMWARVKGKAENHLRSLPLDVYLFRPGYVQPVQGARSKERLYRVLHAVLAPLTPVLRRLAPGHVTTTRNIGRAMLEVAAQGHASRILENPAINALAEEG